MDFKWSTTSSCAYQKQAKVGTVGGARDGDLGSLIHHILSAFSPEEACATVVTSARLNPALIVQQ